MKGKQEDQLAEAPKALEAKKSEARKLWPDFEKAKTAAVAAGAEAMDETSPVFVALDEAGKAYDTVCDEVKAMESGYQRLVGLFSEDAPSPAGTGEKPQMFEGVVSSSDIEPGALQKNIKAFMGEYHNWRAQIGDSTLGNPKGRFGQTPEITLIDKSDIRAALTLTTAFPSLPTRRPGIVPLLLENLQLLNLITFIPVTTETVEYVYEKTFTNAAVETLEAHAAGEGTIDLDVASTTVKWIPFTIPATRQILADESRMQSWIEQKIVYGIRDRLQRQIVNGNGIGPNLRGITATPNILTLDWTTDHTANKSDVLADVVHRAKTKVIVATYGMYTPQTFILNPLDEEQIVLSKDKYGQYYFGGPQRDSAAPIWGMTPVSHPAIAEGSPIVCDIRGCEAYVREDITLSVTDSHEDHFVKGIVDFLASGRFGFAVTQPKAFCEMSTFGS